MPTDTAMEILNAYKLKRSQNPAADQATLFKYILWDRFKNQIIADSKIDEMVRQCSNLSELTLAVVRFEKPVMADARIEASAREAIRKFYTMNFPDGL